MPVYALRLGGFNSRTPGGVRPNLTTEINDEAAFQFTHPGRGATARRDRQLPAEARFNSRTPGGVRLRDRLL